MATNNAINANSTNPMIVANGGTGGATHTAYAVVCGGTTSTGALQSIAGVGTSGQVLTSNGAGALPTFQTGGGVTSATGTANQITVSAATGAVTWSLPSAITAPGSLTTTTTLAGGTTVTAGTDLISTAGNLLLPTTSSTVGNIKFNNVVYAHAFGTNSIFLGNLAGNYTYTGNGQHAAVGTSSLAAMTSAVHNSTLGYQAGLGVTSGSDNVLIGWTCGDAVTTSSDNVAIGSNAMGALTTSTGSNVCMGSSSLAQVTTGNTNIAIGIAAAFNLTGSDSQNIMIGQCRGTAGDNTKIRIGFTTTNTALITKTFIDGIRGVTTDAADAVAVLVSSTGQLGTVSSSIRYKEDIEDMEDESTRLFELRPVTFSYKTHPGKKQFGLIAEEVLDSFPELVVYNEDGDPDSVKYHDLPVLLLNELQKMARRLEHLERDCTCR